MIDFIGKKRLEGVIPALILTIDKKGKINYSYFEKQVNYLISAGVDGLFINGTTGEESWLTIEEKIQVIKAIKEISKGKIFLCTACLQPSTEMVINEIRAFEKYEPDYIVAVTPYYYSVPQEAIMEHFKKIAHYSSVPLII